MWNLGGKNNEHHLDWFKSANISCSLQFFICKVFIFEQRNSKAAHILLILCLSYDFAGLHLCYVLNLSLVFEIVDIVCDGIM